MLGKIKRTTWYFLQTIIVAPLVVAVVAFGLWLAVASAMESAKFVRATNLILDTLLLARGMSTDYDIKTAALIENLYRRDPTSVKKAEGSEYGAIINPWGGEINVNVLPRRLLRFDISLAPSVCRRLLMFYGNDATSLGLRKVEVRDDLQGAAWGMIYNAAEDEAERKIENTAIKVGCGSAERVVLALTFRLR